MFTKPSQLASPVAFLEQTETVGEAEGREVGLRVGVGRMVGIEVEVGREVEVEVGRIVGIVVEVGRRVGIRVGFLVGVGLEAVGGMFLAIQSEKAKPT